MNEMAKPILLVRLESRADLKIREKAAKVLGNTFYDYHVLTVIGKSNQVEIEVHNAINATDIEIEELKKIVLKQIEA